MWQFRRSARFDILPARSQPRAACARRPILILMDLIIQASAVHGAGVYTTQPIKSGAHVLEYTGHRISARQTDGMYADSEVTYLFGMDGGKTVIDGFGMAAFVNHACRPNCETDEIDKSIWIIALEDIPDGTELTYDYNIYYDETGEQCT